MSNFLPVLFDVTLNLYLGIEPDGSVQVPSVGLYSPDTEENILFYFTPSLGLIKSGFFCSSAETMFEVS